MLNDEQVVALMADELACNSCTPPDDGGTEWAAGLWVGFRVGQPIRAEAMRTIDPEAEGGCRALVREALALERMETSR